MKITDILLTINQYSRPGTKIGKITKIAVHYVGNPNTTAAANRNYFEGLKVGKKNEKGNYIFASSHYLVGMEGEIIRCIPENEYSYCTNAANGYSISIECCHPLADGKFTAATCTSLIELLADLCTRYKLDPLTDIIRHYDVTEKACPMFHVNNPAAWTGLKQDIARVMSGAALPVKDYTDVCLNGKFTEIRAYNENGTNMAKLSELARLFPDTKIAVRYVMEQDGYKQILWDGESKTIFGVK